MTSAGYSKPFIGGRVVGPRDLYFASLISQRWCSALDSWASSTGAWPNPGRLDVGWWRCSPCWGDSSILGRLDVGWPRSSYQTASHIMTRLGAPFDLTTVVNAYQYQLHFLYPEEYWIWARLKDMDWPWHGAQITLTGPISNPEYAYSPRYTQSPETHLHRFDATPNGYTLCSS